MSPDPPPRAAAAAAAAALASAALISALVACACPQEVAGVPERRSPMWPLGPTSGSVASALSANPWLDGNRAEVLRIGAGAPLSSVRLPGFPSHLFQPGGIYTLPGFLAGMRMGQEMLQMSMHLNAALNGLGSYPPALPPLQRMARSARLDATLNNG